jgi:hypothetical protein
VPSTQPRPEKFHQHGIAIVSHAKVAGDFH